MKSDITKYINVYGAKENNLKNINVSIPKNKLVIVTGVSGSGKSTLAFDTLYQEGQRRYIESLSSYARQFLGNFEKPNVDKIEGLSPSIAIDQKSSVFNPRSTVGTQTEIYDYIRLLFASIGKPFTLDNKPLVRETIQEITAFAMKLLETKIQILIKETKLSNEDNLDFLKRIQMKGYNRVLIGSQVIRIDEEKIETEQDFLYIIISTITVSDDKVSRIFETIETAFKENAKVIYIRNTETNELTPFSEHYHFQDKIFEIPKIEPRLFSFNVPIGACPNCKGLGSIMTIEPDLVFDLELSIKEGAIIPAQNNNEDNLQSQVFEIAANFFQIDTNTPLKLLDKEKLQKLYFGSPELIEFNLISKSGRITKKIEQFEGVVNHYQRRFDTTTAEWFREWLGKFAKESVCKQCEGKRLNQSALSVKINDLNIFELSDLSVKKLLDFLSNLTLTEEEKAISLSILKEIKDRLSFLNDVGLSYLNLNRSAATLSGGELQRIRLATQIGAKLSGVLYVLDEPSIGLHQADNAKLINTLCKMRDLGNTLVVVEHDTETMEAADWIIDIGPKAGDFGGELVAEGTPKDFVEKPKSLTGYYLSGKTEVPTPTKRRPISDFDYIEISKAHENNLKNINTRFYLNVLTVVTGVSGSGKSSLVQDVLLKSLQIKLGDTKLTKPKVEWVQDFSKIKKIIEISQAPIGRTPRSNPATYIGVFDYIRGLFAELPLAKQRGYQKGRFSFNVKGGRCEECKGDGLKKISMHFLPDVYVKCSLCNGTRFNSETLQVKYKDFNIADVLEMRVEEAVSVFKNFPQIYKRLSVMQEVGLGYIKLGQASDTLSGGEAQRVKLASELHKEIRPGTIFILDEPTTGLHQEDVKKLCQVLHKLVDKGTTMVVIEHNLDVIKQADWIIDLGPHGGDEGGEIVAKGTVQEICENPRSLTGKYLRKVLKIWLEKYKNSQLNTEKLSFLSLQTSTGKL